MNLPLNTNLTGKVAVVTGAAGTLCSVFSKALAASGAKVALLGRTYANVQKLADEITAEGGTAKAYECNVLDNAAVMACHEQVLADLGPCDILLNGAGGNHPSATTDKEYYEPGDLDADTKSFFDLDETGVASVFNLNFMGILIPTQAFARDMVAREGCNIINISSMNAYTPLTKIPAYSGAKSAVSNFTQWLAVHFSKAGIEEDSSRDPHGPLRTGGRIAGRTLVPAQQRSCVVRDRRGHPRGRRLLGLQRCLTWRISIKSPRMAAFRTRS